MTADEAETGSTPTGVTALLRGGIRWLRDLHRGYAYTGHLPRRER